jgi:phage gpG-like protein
MATFLDIKSKLSQALKDGLRAVGVEAQKYFQKQIDKQTDIKGNTFAKRTYETRTQIGKKILKDRNNLYDSIEVLEIDYANMSVTVGINTPGIADYAEIHNEGGEIVVTEKMKAFFWAKYYENENKQSTKQRGERRNTKQNKQLSQDALFWRNLALKKVGDKITIPQRQFIGENEELKTLLTNELNNFLNDIDL